MCPHVCDKDGALMGVPGSGPMGGGAFAGQQGGVPSGWEPKTSQHNGSCETHGEFVVTFARKANTDCVGKIMENEK